jgi:hypothetical protein
MGKLVLSIILIPTLHWVCTNKQDFVLGILWAYEDYHWLNISFTDVETKA